MSLATFQYRGSVYDIQCQENELISNIIPIFCNKAQIDRKNLCFLCNGSRLNEQLPLSQIPLNNNETKRIILVVDIIEDNPIEECIKKSDNIICPECKESIIISIKDYKISLSQCKKGHKIKNLSLSKFKESQNIDISKILCGLCKKSKAEIEQNQLFLCNTCNLNLCPLCKSIHDINHNIINYDDKPYICPKDGVIYGFYCMDCKKNVCSSCEEDHIDQGHNTIPFSLLNRNKNKFAVDYYQLENYITNFKNIVNDLVSKLNKVIENINIYYEIVTKVMNSIQRKKKNYEEILSINELDIIKITKDMNNIFYEKY